MRKAAAGATSQIITINRNLTERRIKRLVLEVDSALKFYSPEKSRSKPDRNDSGATFLSYPKRVVAERRLNALAGAGFNRRSATKWIVAAGSTG
jgi:hypothetical protein